MSYESKITKKGQVTIPAELRKEYNLQPGKRVFFIPIKDGVLIKPMTHQLPTLRGILKSNVKIKDIEKEISDIRGKWRLDNE